MCARDSCLSRTATLFLEPVPHLDCDNSAVSQGKVTYCWKPNPQTRGVNGGISQREFAPKCGFCPDMARFVDSGMRTGETRYTHIGPATERTPLPQVCELFCRDGGSALHRRRPQTGLFNHSRSDRCHARTPRLRDVAAHFREATRHPLCPLHQSSVQPPAELDSTP